MVSTTTVSVERRVARLALQQEARDDAHHLAAGLEGGIGHQPHQADPTAAINQGYAFAGQKLAQPCGDIPACGIGAEARATKDADGGGGGFHFSTRTGNGDFYLQTIRRLSGPGQHGIISQRKVATPMGAGSRTVGRVMSRTVIWLVVGGAIVIAAGLGVAWQVRMSEQAVLDRATKTDRRRAAVRAVHDV